MIPMIIVGMFVLCGLQASAQPFHPTNHLQLWEQQPSQHLMRSDVLDQSQPLWNWFAPIGPIYLVAGRPNYIVAQSFTPTKPILTRVELMIGRNSTTTYDYTLAIRDALNGPDLTSESVAAGQIPVDNFSWIEFDFPDITVIPGNIYYLVSSTVNATDNWYGWGTQLENVYLNGTIYFTLDEGVTWEEESDSDMTFQTYGRENIPPNEPLINGETNGKYGTEYDYTFVTDDLDGDDVYYWIIWGDGCPAVEWIGPYASGEIVTVPHTFTSKGTFTISAKAKDTVGAEGAWGYLEVSMPQSHNTGTYPILNRLFNRFPNLFPFLRFIGVY